MNDRWHKSYLRQLGCCRGKGEVLKVSLYKRAVKIEDLPPDDDWIQDDVWDEVYQQEVI